MAKLGAELLVLLDDEVKAYKALGQHQSTIKTAQNSSTLTPHPNLPDFPKLRC
ncbi:hypothetical protein CLV76_1436 [Marivita geojedonensis]|nr:hypothetical protein CLV76_1436 [Marivita geojedonensis]